MMHSEACRDADDDSGVRGRGGRLARLAIILNPEVEWVRATEHAPRNPFRV